MTVVDTSHYISFFSLLIYQFMSQHREEYQLVMRTNGAKRSKELLLSFSMNNRTQIVRVKEIVHTDKKSDNLT